MAQILITGGTGLVGKRLTEALLAKGHTVRHFSRNANASKNVPSYNWDISNGELDQKALEGVEHIVHLAGAPIVAKKWTASRIQELYNSRIKSTAMLFDAVEALGIQLQGFHAASASGYYGAADQDHLYIETDQPGSTIAADLTVKWEESVKRFEQNCRTVRFRIGIVLAEDGGAIPEMIRPIKLGFGSPLGSGKQWVPWIHVDDLVGLFVHSVQNESMSGAYNAVSSDPATNAEFTKRLAKVLKKPYWAPNVPKFVMRLILGKRSDLVLNGSRLSNEKVKRAGYVFKHPDLNGAIEDLLAR